MPPNSIVLNPKPVIAFISPLGFHKYASEFLDIAESVNVNSNSRFSPVPYYLYCRSLELALKAFLLTKNISVKSLKLKLGHDLVKTLDKAKAVGLVKHINVTSKYERELVKANKYYLSKGFEYFEVAKAVKGYPDLPEISVISEFASDMISALESICLNAVQET